MEQSALRGVLQPNPDTAMTDFQPFEIIPGDPRQTMVLLADHAMNRLPAEYGDLGLPASAFDRHIAYDIGVEQLTRRLAHRLGMPAVLSCFSRLLIDPNRGEDDPTLIMKLSDGAVIPANHPLGDAERQHRLDAFHRPYHAAVAATIEDSTRTTGRAPVVISIHSFTPIWKGAARPWHAAVLWDKDPRAVAPFLDALRADPALVVGDNEPYEGALEGDTIYRHGTSAGRAHALLEIRQDLIGDDAGIEAWVDRLAPILEGINALADLHEVRHYGSLVD
ncbi:putative N-formylglutamate amidohydrolase [Hoeflea marina]|uniref:Putative N-formylglutamate amidohydrolase n=2 Tax=Hoeflea marina TaxID=274592 RepID=A0A317PE90_9HYPH|nr:putative N-formylglutamate amidohydrolase [Hoeflea marina]